LQARKQKIRVLSHARSVIAAIKFKRLQAA